MNLIPTLLQIPDVVPPTSPWQFLAFVLVTIVANFLLQEIKSYYEKRKETKAEVDKSSKVDANLRHNNDIQRKIKETLIQIQGYTECSRASLYNYHNGIKTHYEYCMNFMSMVEEKTDGIVVPLIDTMQRVPAAIFRPVIDRVDNADSGHVMIRKEDLAEEDRAIYDRYQNRTCYYFKVGNSVWEGVVELAWVNKHMQLSDDEVHHVQGLVNVISDLQRSLIKI
jgi:hypothetical protein